MTELYQALKQQLQKHDVKSRILKRGAVLRYSSKHDVLSPGTIHLIAQEVTNHVGAKNPLYKIHVSALSPGHGEITAERNTETAPESKPSKQRQRK